MKKYWLFLMLIFAGLVAGPVKAAQKPLKVGYVISDKILMESQAGKAFLERKKALEIQKKEELKQIVTELKELREELTRKGMFMNEDARTQLNEEITAKERKVKRLEEDVYADLRKFVKKEMKRMNDEASAIVMKFGNDNGYTVIYDVSSRSSNIVFIEDGLDITDKILEKYDQSYMERTSSTSSSKPADAGK